MDMRQQAIQRAAQDLIAYRDSDAQPDQRIHLESMSWALDLGSTPQDIEAEATRLGHDYRPPRNQEDTVTTRQEQISLAAEAATRAADLAKETERAANHPDKRSLVLNLSAASTAWSDAAQAHAAIAALLPETEDTRG